MGPHSVTFQPTQVNASRLNPSHAGWYSIYLPRTDERLSWPNWLDSAQAGNRTSDLSITSPTPNHCTTKTSKNHKWSLFIRILILFGHVGNADGRATDLVWSWHWSTYRLEGWRRCWSRRVVKRCSEIQDTSPAATTWHVVTLLHVYRKVVFNNYTVSQKKTRKLWNGTVQNYNDRFWWPLAEILKIL